MITTRINDLNDLEKKLLFKYTAGRGSPTGGWSLSMYIQEFPTVHPRELRTSLLSLVERGYLMCQDGNTDSFFFTEDGVFEANIYFEDDLATSAHKSIIRKPSLSNKRVFIVHGHDELMKTKTARFIEKLDFEAVILHEQANKGMTIIEKIEANTDVDFAIVLYTADDRGNTETEAAKGNLNHRARQNVVFEHGYLIAKLSRTHVVPLVSGRVELPSDISGVVYVDDGANWQIEIAKEMKGAGYAVDLNKIIGS